MSIEHEHDQEIDFEELQHQLFQARLSRVAPRLDAKRGVVREEDSVLSNSESPSHSPHLSPHHSPHHSPNHSPKHSVSPKPSTSQLPGARTSSDVNRGSAADSAPPPFPSSVQSHSVTNPVTGLASRMSISRSRAAGSLIRQKGTLFANSPHMLTNALLAMSPTLTAGVIAGGSGGGGSGGVGAKGSGGGSAPRPPRAPVRPGAFLDMEACQRLFKLRANDHGTISLKAAQLSAIDLGYLLHTANVKHIQEEGIVVNDPMDFLGFLQVQKTLMEVYEGPTETALNEFREAFRIFDRAGSGTITTSSLRFVLEVMGVHSIAEDHLAELIKEGDKDGKGGVDLHDFSCMMFDPSSTAAGNKNNNDNNKNNNSAFKVFDLSKLWSVDQIIASREERGGVPPFFHALSEHFPLATMQTTYVDKMVAAIAPLGFQKDSCIPCLSLCRDELTKPLAEMIEKRLHNSFSLSSIAGMLFCGKTGFHAAHHHAPIKDGRERYLYVVMPHIALDAFGTVGPIKRPGRTIDTKACGSLCAFLGEIEAGKLSMRTDHDDLEQSLMKQRVLGEIVYGVRPSLVQLTKLVHKIIVEDLEHLISLTVDTERADYVVMSGIQIHGPKWMHGEGARFVGGDTDYVWPGRSYACISGEIVEFTNFFPELTCADDVESSGVDIDLDAAAKEASINAGLGKEEKQASGVGGSDKQSNNNADGASEQQK